MSATRRECVACGAAIKIRTSNAKMASALCGDCTKLEYLANGAAVLRMRREPKGACFSLGNIVITPGAVKALAEGPQHVSEFLMRHVRGDRGALRPHDTTALTASGPGEQDRVTSEYTTSSGQRLWVITSLTENAGTTVLLPEEWPA